MTGARVRSKKAKGVARSGRANAPPHRSSSLALGRFAILRHTPGAGKVASPYARRSVGLHWDLLLAPAGSLRAATWRIPTDPRRWFTNPRRAFSTLVEALPPHRLLYLTYEGPVSGERGLVKRIAGGKLRIVRWDLDAIEADLLSTRRIVRLRLAQRCNQTNRWQLRVKLLGALR